MAARPAELANAIARRCYADAVQAVYGQIGPDDVGKRVFQAMRDEVYDSALLAVTRAALCGARQGRRSLRRNGTDDALARDYFEHPDASDGSDGESLGSQDSRRSSEDSDDDDDSIVLEDEDEDLLDSA